MDDIDIYIAKLWEPDKYIARDYIDLDVPEIEAIVRAKRAGKRGRPPYTAERVAFHIWIDSVHMDPLEGLNLCEDLKGLDCDPDLASFTLTAEDLNARNTLQGKRAR